MTLFRPFTGSPFHGRCRRHRHSIPSVRFVCVCVVWQRVRCRITLFSARIDCSIGFGEWLAKRYHDIIIRCPCPWCMLTLFMRINVITVPGLCIKRMGKKVFHCCFFTMTLLLALLALSPSPLIEKSYWWWWCVVYEPCDASDNQPSVDWTSAQLGFCSGLLIWHTVPCTAQLKLGVYLLHSKWPIV